MTLNAKIGGFMDIFWRLWVHSQGGAMKLSLCDPNREFDIYILT